MRLPHPTTTLAAATVAIAASGKWHGTKGRGVATDTRVGAVGTPLHIGH